MSPVVLRLVVVAGCAVLVPSVGLAQEEPVLAAQPPVMVEPAEVELFARTFAEVRQVQATWEARLRETDLAARREVLVEANADMRGVVERSGLDPSRYNDLVVALRADQGFRRQVEERLGEKLSPQVQ